MTQAISPIHDHAPCAPTPHAGVVKPSLTMPRSPSSAVVYAGQVKSLPLGGLTGGGISLVQAARRSPPPRWGRARMGVRTRHPPSAPSLARGEGHKDLIPTPGGPRRGKTRSPHPSPPPSRLHKGGYQVFLSFPPGAGRCGSGGQVPRPTPTPALPVEGGTRGLYRRNTYPGQRIKAEGELWPMDVSAFPPLPLPRQGETCEYTSDPRKSARRLTGATDLHYAPPTA